MDRGACRTVVGWAGAGLGRVEAAATVHRVTKSRTRMKQLSKHTRTYGIPSSRMKDQAVIKCTGLHFQALFAYLIKYSAETMRI